MGRDKLSFYKFLPDADFSINSRIFQNCGGWPHNWYMFPVGYCENLPPHEGSSPPHGGVKNFPKFSFANFFIDLPLAPWHNP